MKRLILISTIVPLMGSIVFADPIEGPLIITESGTTEVARFTLDYSNTNDGSLNFYYDNDTTLGLGTFHIKQSNGDWLWQTGTGTTPRNQMTLINSGTLTLFGSGTQEHSIELTPGTETGVIGTIKLKVGSTTEKVLTQEYANTQYVRSFGAGNLALGTYSGASNGSFAGGNFSVASGTNSTASGNNVEALGNYSVALGHYAKARGYAGVALGGGAETGTSSSAAISIGNYAKSYGSGTVSLGCYNEAYGFGSFAAGVGSRTGSSSSGMYSPQGAIALGNYTYALGHYSVSLGSGNNATYTASVAIGEGNYSNGLASVAIGQYNDANGQASVAMGYDNTTNLTSGDYSTAMGQKNTTGGKAALASGRESVSMSNYANVLGVRLQAYRPGQLIVGAFNQPESTNPAGDIGYTLQSEVFAVGNGYQYANGQDPNVFTNRKRLDEINVSNTTTVRQNAFVVRWSGDAEAQKDVIAGGALKAAKGVISTSTTDTSDFDGPVRFDNTVRIAPQGDIGMGVFVEGGQ